MCGGNDRTKRYQPCTARSSGRSLLRLFWAALLVKAAPQYSHWPVHVSMALLEFAFFRLSGPNAGPAFSTVCPPTPFQCDRPSVPNQHSVPASFGNAAIAECFSASSLQSTTTVLLAYIPAPVSMVSSATSLPLSVVSTITPSSTTRFSTVQPSPSSQLYLIPFSNT